MSLVELVEVTFGGNSAQNAGGAIYLSDYLGTAAQLVSSHFHDNQAHAGPGGAVFAAATTIDLTNSIVSNNSTTGDYWSGGGIAAASGSTLSVYNSTFTGNATADYGSGGAIYADETTLLVMRNSIAWGDTASTFDEIAAAGADLRFCDVADWCVQGEDCADGNLNTDPQFIGANDLRLSPTSPALDVGEITLLPLDTFDLDYDLVLDESLPVDMYGNSRVYGVSLDLGALESQPY